MIGNVPIHAIRFWFFYFSTKRLGKNYVLPLKCCVMAISERTGSPIHLTRVFFFRCDVHVPFCVCVCGRTERLACVCVIVYCF